MKRIFRKKRGGGKPFKLQDYKPIENQNISEIEVNDIIMNNIGGLIKITAIFNEVSKDLEKKCKNKIDELERNLKDEKKGLKQPSAEYVKLVGEKIQECKARIKEIIKTSNDNEYYYNKVTNIETGEYNLFLPYEYLKYNIQNNGWKILRDTKVNTE